MELEDEEQGAHDVLSFCLEETQGLFLLAMMESLRRREANILLDELMQYEATLVWTITFKLHQIMRR